MVSSLHSSVLGNNVYGANSTTSVRSTSSSTSSTSLNTTAGSSSFASNFDTATFSSTGRMMAAEGSSPPDFNSMSTEEFRDHLVELQAKMESEGIDTSSFVDPTEMSDEDLNALKDEMASMGSRGKNGPPPPPPPSSETSSYSTMSTTTTEDTLLSLLNSLEEGDSVSGAKGKNGPPPPPPPSETDEASSTSDWIQAMLDALAEEEDNLSNEYMSVFQQMTGISI